MSTKEWREKNKDKLRTYRRKWYKNNKEHARKKVRERVSKLLQWLKEYKLTLHCSQCLEDHPATLDFHHRDPEEKEINISHMVRQKGWGKERMIEEIEKCDVLCANCHRKLHASVG